MLFNNNSTRNCEKIKNFPYDIEEEPIVWTIGDDGKPHVVPAKSEEEIKARLALIVTPKPAPERRVRKVAQEARELNPGGVLGVNLGIACNLLAAGIYNLPRALEYLADHNCLGQDRCGKGQDTCQP